MLTSTENQRMKQFKNHGLLGRHAFDLLFWLFFADISLKCLTVLLQTPLHSLPQLTSNACDSENVTFMTDQSALGIV